MKTAFATMLVTSSGDPSPPNPAVTHPTPSHVVLAVGRLPAPLGMQSEAHFARESAKQLEQSKVHATSPRNEYGSCRSSLHSPTWRRRATSPSPAGKTRRCQVHYFWSSAQVLSEFRNQRMHTSVSSTARKRHFQTRLTAGLRHAPSLWHRVCGAFVAPQTRCHKGPCSLGHHPVIEFVAGVVGKKYKEVAKWSRA